jgi:hypothetical protein
MMQPANPEVGGFPQTYTMSVAPHKKGPISNVLKKKVTMCATLNSGIAE